HAAVADLSGEPGIVGAEQRGAHPRMDAVGADDDVGLDLAAILKTGQRPLIDRHFQARPRQRAPGRRTADPAPDDYHARHRSDRLLSRALLGPHRQWPAPRPVYGAPARLNRSRGGEPVGRSSVLTILRS